jgi:Gametolysin peptidase M11
LKQQESTLSYSTVKTQTSENGHSLRCNDHKKLRTHPKLPNDTKNIEINYLYKRFKPIGMMTMMVSIRRLLPCVALPILIMVSRVVSAREATSTISLTATTSDIDTSLFASNDLYRWREQLIQKQDSHRQLEVDFRSVLVIRIITGSDSDGSITENEINNVLFYEATEITVQKQMQLCSAGRVQFQPQGIITAQVNLGGNVKVEAWTEAASEKVMKDHYRSTDTLTGYKEQLRKVADHILFILPESFAGKNFVANAEIGRPICVFTYEWLASLSAYMHEMGHNLGLRHSGKGSALPYADNTGYMGISNPKAYGPRKCYNAAQHWGLNWYDSKRISLVGMDISSRPVVLQVAAFVDHDKIGSDYTVLVQLNANTYLQFNRAKSYNVDTDMLQDQIVVISDPGDKTVLIGGLVATSNTLRLSSIAVKVCSITIGAEAGIDYAVVAVASSDNGNMCSGAILTSASAIATTPAPILTSTPIKSPTATPTTYAPSTYEPTISTNEPTAKVVAPIVFTAPTAIRVATKTSKPTYLYVSSSNPTDQEEKRGDDGDEFNPVVIKTPIFISSSTEEIGQQPDTSSTEKPVRSSSKAKATGNPIFLPVLLALVGVAVLSVLVTVRRMTIHRYYSSKPLRTNDDTDDDADVKSDRTGKTFLDDMEVSTNVMVANFSSLLRDYEVDLGGGNSTSDRV